MCSAGDPAVPDKEVSGARGGKWGSLSWEAGMVLMGKQEGNGNVDGRLRKEILEPLLKQMEPRLEV